VTEKLADLVERSPVVQTVRPRAKPLHGCRKADVGRSIEGNRVVSFKRPDRVRRWRAVIRDRRPPEMLSMESEDIHPEHAMGRAGVEMLRRVVLAGSEGDEEWQQVLLRGVILHCIRSEPAIFRRSHRPNHSWLSKTTCRIELSGRTSW
jgi:hypothetical protein